MMIEGPALPALDDMMWIGNIPRAAAAACPDQTAILVPELDVSLSFGELERRIGRALAVLKERGIKPGSRLAYLGKNSDNFYVLLFAAIRGGFILLPLNWRCVAEEIGFFLSDSGAELLICDLEFLPIAEQAGMIASLSIPVLSTEREASNKPGLRQELEQQGPCLDVATPQDDAVCLQLYTSGTTGKPKGTLCTHKALSFMRLAEIRMPGFPRWSGGAIVAAMPSFHIGGISWMLMGLMRHSTCVLTTNSSAGNLVRLLRDYEASSTFTVATVIRGMVDELRATGQKLPALRTLFYGAAPIGKTLLEQALATLGCGFGQFFGMTEITGSATFLTPDRHSPERPELLNSVGQPLPGMAVDIRDAHGVSVPAGTAGEIWLRTPTVMAGYWNRPEATCEVLQDGWYRTGDGGRLDDEGFLYLTDRIKDMVVSGGENIYPAEIEEALRGHPAVRDVAVVGFPHDRWGEAVTALIERRPDHNLDELTLISYARTRLAGYKCPKTVIFVEALPRTASGKVQRAKAKLEALDQFNARSSSRA